MYDVEGPLDAVGAGNFEELRGDLLVFWGGGGSEGFEFREGGWALELDLAPGDEVACFCPVGGFAESEVEFDVNFTRWDVCQTGDFELDCVAWEDI